MDSKPDHGKGSEGSNLMSASLVNWKVSQLVFCTLLAISSLTAVAEVKTPDSPKRYMFDLPQQSVADSLNDIATQSGAQFLFPFQLAKSKTAKPITGHFTLLEATAQLLQNTGLKSDLVDGVLTISPVDDAGTSGNQNHKGKNMNTNARKTVLASMVGLFAAGGMATATAQDSVGESARAQGVLDEIVVTATKRETSLQETAGSIAAIGNEEISRKGIAGMEDYLATVPGVSFLDRGVGQNNFVVRGIAADTQGEAQRNGPSVGVYFGEVPLAGLGLAGGAANPRLVDMNRVEVLRGPQGTLFGSGSLSGALRMIPNAPIIDDFEGSVKFDYSNTGGNGSDNSKIEGMLNIPVIKDVLAVRAVAYSHDISGYIRNVAARNETYAAALNSYGSVPLDEGNMGAVEYTGGRVSVLWQPIDSFSANLTYIDQEANQDGSPDGQLNSSKFTQLRPSFGNIPAMSPIQGDSFNFGANERLEEDLSITNLVLDYDFGFASILTSSSWVDQENLLARHSAFFFPAEDAGFPHPEVPFPVSQMAPFTSDFMAHEIRMVSNLEGKFQYLAGAYYEEFDRGTPVYFTFSGSDEANPYGFPFGTDNGLFSDEFIGVGLKQVAYFAELSYDINEQIEFTLGGRRYEYERSRLYLLTGLFGDNLAEGGRKNSFEESGDLYKAKLAYQVNDDNLLYAQWSEGFRPGSTNNPAPASICDVDNDGILDGTGVPIQDFFESDTLESYELGVKSTVLDGRMRVNAAIYQNNWEGIPIAVQSPTCLFSQVGNAGEAETTGVEVETIVNMNDALQLIFGGSYVDAKLTKDALSLGGESGDRLPGSPRYTFNLGIQYDFEMASYPSYIRTDYARVGGFYNNLSQTGQEVGDYGKLDAKIGLAVGSFNFELFGHNLTDDDSITWLATDLPDSRVNYLRPRTMGLSVGYNF